MLQEKNTGLHFNYNIKRIGPNVFLQKDSFSCQGELTPSTVLILNKDENILRIRRKHGGIPYTAHGAQITPLPYFLFVLFFVFILILGLVR